jgi:hypothetical protein
MMWDMAPMSKPRLYLDSDTGEWVCFSRNGLFTLLARADTPLAAYVSWARG